MKFSLEAKAMVPSFDDIFYADNCLSVRVSIIKEKAKEERL